MRPLPAVPGVEHRFLDVRGLRMHVAEAGEGEPLVLLHTSFQHWYAWRGVIPPLAERYRVICPDLRGAGWTDAPARGYDKETMARDVCGLMDALGLERVRLAGHGLGGFIGFLLALRNPERVRSYLALGVGHPWPTDARLLTELWRAWYQLVVAAPLLGPPAVARGLSAWVLRDADATVPYRALLRDPARARALSLTYRTFLLREMAPLAAGRYCKLRLSVPTLLLLGTRDPFFPPRIAAGYERFADDMRVELLEGEGHYPHERSPRLIAGRAMEFFDA
jgi:pimeloyl-ACP methyl ester carboxylesterase